MTSGTRSWAWLTDHWRLKLLSGFLAVILFGTVAFAQNPITVRTLHVRISSYQITDQNLVLIKFPTHVEVQVVGLADAVNPVAPDDIAAAMDLSKVAAPTGPPQQVQVSVNLRTVAPGVTLQQTSIPVFVTVDSITSASVPISVQNQAAPGVTIDKVVIEVHGTTNPVSTVGVTGPASLINGLKAYVDLGLIEGTTEFPGAPVKFQDASGRTVRWPPATIPIGSLDTPSVDVFVQAHQTQQQKEFTLVFTTTGQPACGYAPSGSAVWAPSEFVTVTGDASALQQAGGTISLSPIDLTGATGPVKSTQKIVAPPGTTVTPATVTVTIPIKQAYSCSPASPTPTPAATPSP